MEQILHAYGLPKETVTAIMMLYKNMFRSLGGDTNFFDVIAGILQGDTLTPIFFLYSAETTCFEYAIKENGFSKRLSECK